MTPNNVRTFAGLQILTRQTETGICLAVYGTGGGGKTTTLANIVHSEYGRPAILFDAEGGSKSVEHLIEKGLDIVTISKWSEVEAARKALRGDHPYKSVIWDNVSEISAICMKSITQTTPQIQHWGEMTARMLEFVREFRDMSRIKGINALFCLWEETEKDELTQTIRKKVNLTPKFASAFPGIVTMVGRLTVPGKAPDYIRKLTFAPSVDTDAKFRVAPTEAAANIPLEIFLRKDERFLADFLATVREGKPFPVAKYSAPERAVNRS